MTRNAQAAATCLPPTVPPLTNSNRGSQASARVDTRAASMATLQVSEAMRALQGTEANSSDT